MPYEYENANIQGKLSRPQPAQMDSETWRARRTPATSAYLVDPQQARKAATASARDMPLMRSIARMWRK